MGFVPDVPSEAKQVPYYEDATSANGWQGQSTTKSIKALQSEIMESIGRLGALVTGFQRGTFQGEEGIRDGFRIHYAVEATNGRQVLGRIDVAALPIRPDLGFRADKDRHRESSLKMALYMLRVALDGTWFLQQLSPGYSALVPFMLAKGTDKTISEIWTESSIMNNLLPPGDEEFIDSTATEL